MFNQKSKIDWRLVARYLSGECSPEEKAVIDARISQDKAYREVFLQARDAWEVTHRPDEGIDEKRAWNVLMQKIRQQDRPPTSLKIVRHVPTSANRASVIRNNQGWRRTSSWGIALAALAVLMIAVVLLRDALPPQPEAEELLVFQTTAGQRASITLPDGSEAMLNAESRIQLLSSPRDSMRIVQLDGEAFFDIARDSTRPFVIHARHGEVQVLGTSFNMLAYPETAGIQVAVTEGIVELRNSNNQQSIRLHENTIGEVEEGGDARYIEDVSIEHILAWSRGQLIFERTSLDEVQRTLERWFDLEIHTTSDVSHHHLTATFSDPNPNNVIEVIANTFDLEYTINENIVTIYDRP